MSTDATEHKVHTITGELLRTDGVVVQFMIHEHGFTQWGATTQVLGETVELVDALNVSAHGIGLADRDGEETEQ